MRLSDRLIEHWTPRAISLLRMVAAYLFIQHGTAKIFHVPHFPMYDHVPFASVGGVAGVLEIFGGIMLLIGLYVRPAALLLSGEMAVGYFIAHAPQGHVLAPLLNQGEPAVLYCFIFLMLAVSGAGPWSMDRLLERRRALGSRAGEVNMAIPTAQAHSWSRPQARVLVMPSRRRF
jgi:putative oxidoreductase